jgi:hypothetical protein
MKKNKYILIIVVALAIVAGFLWFSKSSGTISREMMDFAVKDTASITKIFLVDKKNNSILLEKKKPGDWLLNGKYTTSNPVVNMLLETMMRIVPKAPVPKSAHDNVVKQLAAASVKVEIYREVYRIDMFGLKLFPHEKLTKTYFVGNPTADNMGSLMLMKGASIPFIVHILNFRGFVSPRYSTIENDWRDHMVFQTKLADIKSITMEIPDAPDESFKVVNDNKSPKLYTYPKGELISGYDTLKLLNFMLSFEDLRYEAILNQDVIQHRIDSVRNSTPKFILTLEDVKNEITQLKAFYRPNDEKKYDESTGKLYVHDLDRLYAFVNDSDDFLMIQYFVFGRVLIQRSDFEIGTEGRN